MKFKKVLVLTAAMLVLGTGAVLADSLSVTSTAALGGAAQNPCSGDGQPGPCGLEVFHDNTSKAFVQDDTPNRESVYRGSFLFDPNSIGPPGAKFRQNIFSAMSPNPDRNNFSCPGTILVSSLRVYLLWKNGVYSLQGRVRGNRCGERATLPRVINIADGPLKVCFELETGNSLNGRVALAAVGPNDACPPSGSSAWAERDVSNGKLSVTQARMGAVAQNNFGAGEVGNLYFDEFESFRTLAP